MENKELEQKTLQEILVKLKNRKDFVIPLGNQNIHISFESKIPFVLVMPSHIEDGQTLVMESNNMETNNSDLLLKQALETAKDLNDILNGNTPILILLLPSELPNAPYYQQLSSECFKNGERLDLDIIESLNKAKKTINDKYGVHVNERIFLNGASFKYISYNLISSIFLPPTHKLIHLV